jgi:ubiquitin-protein ligase
LEWVAELTNPTTNNEMASPETGAAKRLLRDQLELKRNANQLANIAAAPLEGNIMVWHCNLRREEGKLAGIILHLELCFPPDYPASAPKVVVCTNLPHPNVHRTTAGSSGFELCCDMLGNCADNANMGGTYHGWSTSYSVLSVIMQLQAFLLDSDLMYAYNTSGTTIEAALEHARNYTCSASGHTYDKPWPAFETLEDETLDRNEVTLPAVVHFEFMSTKRQRLQAAKADTKPSIMPTPASPTNSCREIDEMSPQVSPQVNVETWTTVPIKHHSRKAAPKTAPEPETEDTGCANYFDGLLKRQAFKKSVLSKAASKASRNKPKQGVAPKKNATVQGNSGNFEAEEPEMTKAQRKNMLRAEKRRLKREGLLSAVEATPTDEVIVSTTVTVSTSDSATTTDSATKTTTTAITASGTPSTSRALLASTRPFLSGSDNAGGFSKTRYDDLLQIFSFLGVKDVGSMQCSCWYLYDIGRDGNLWKKLFSQHYPRSHLSAASMAGWKQLYQLEREQAHSSLHCFHSKRSFDEPDASSLGVPCVITTNPRTGLVDYVYSSFDTLSQEAFKEGVRTDISGESFTHWLPLYLTHQHFQRGIEAGHVQRALLRLSGGQFYDSKVAAAEADAQDEGGFRGKQSRGKARGGRPSGGRRGGRDTVQGMTRSDRFHPYMALEVLPKLMNTSVVLMSDKGVHASDKAIDGYCQCHRLLVALLHQYPILQAEVQRRLTAFVGNEKNRTKQRCPNLGALLPLLSVSNEFSWGRHMAQPMLQETFDRNVLWICKEYASFATLTPLTDTQIEEDRLQHGFEASVVSKRLLMFHATFLNLVARPFAPGAFALRGGKRMRVEEVAMRADRLYGCPDLDLKKRFRKSVTAILAADTWPKFFKLVGYPCPGKAQLTTMLRESVQNSVHKGYHKAGMDFSKVHSSGVSKILLKGESYSASPALAKVRMQEVWHWSGSSGTLFLDASALMYDFQGKYQGYVDYSSNVFSDPTKKGTRSVVHSGDQMDDSKHQGVHTIELNLKQMPSTSTVYFTMSAWSSAKLVDIKQPYVRLFDVDTDAELCQYEFDKTKEKSFGKKTAIIMCKLHRQAASGSWKVTAIGNIGYGQAGNYKPMLETIEQLRTGGSGSAARSA